MLVASANTSALQDVEIITWDTTYQGSAVKSLYLLPYLLGPRNLYLLHITY